jgi:hypothetical protein
MGQAVTSSAVIVLIIAAGFLARGVGILRAGDERVLNGFVYFFAFPAFLLSKLAEIRFSSETLRFLAAGAAPIAALLALLLLARWVFKLRRDQFYLLAVGSVFGSLAFFGLPFIEVVLGPEEPVRLAVAMIAAVAPFTVGLVLVLLELYGLEGVSVGRAILDVLRKFSRNPLIIALVLGLAVSLSGAGLPLFLGKALGLLGGAAAPVALFSLGVFLQGRAHTGLLKAAGLASLRLLLLPALTALFAWLWGLGPAAREVAVLMNGTPIAVNMIVLSARYRFFEPEVATLILLSTLGALFTMNLWVFLV